MPFRDGLLGSIASGAAQQIADSVVDLAQVGLLSHRRLLHVWLEGNAHLHVSPGDGARLSKLWVLQGVGCQNECCVHWAGRCCAAEARLVPQLGSFLLSPAHGERLPC